MTSHKYDDYYESYIMLISIVSVIILCKQSEIVYYNLN